MKEGGAAGVDYGSDDCMAFWHQYYGYQKMQCAGMDACSGRIIDRDSACVPTGRRRGYVERDAAGDFSFGNGFCHEKSRLR